VELSPRYSPAPTDAGCVGPTYVCRTKDLRTASHTRRLTHVAFQLRGRGSSRAETLERRRFRALLTSIARALLVELRAPGSPGRFAEGSGRPFGSSPQPRLSSDATPRRAAPSKEPRCFPPHRNPYASEGLLSRARLDRVPVTPPPWRHCSGERAPFLPPRGALF